ncbi:MAG: phosphatase PAP2 family protein [Gemmatimonadota bacterium]|nr:phosphatase PAP2 family protein [Gemmatimonadota bacterium]
MRSIGSELVRPAVPAVAVVRGVFASLALLAISAAPLPSQQTDLAASGTRWSVDTVRLFSGSSALAVALMPLDEEVRRGLQQPFLQESPLAASAAHLFGAMGEPVPLAALGAGTLIAWAAGHDETRNALLHVLSALAVSGTMVFTMKAAAGRARPFLDRGPWAYASGRGLGSASFRSFPSGHTSQSFTFATSLPAELRAHTGWHAPWLTAGLHVAAGLTGLSRIYHDRHWSSDVVVGAALGIVGSRLTHELFHR